MEVQPDFRELLLLFNAHSVEYIIVGAYALAHHGAPRYTGDLDLHVRPEPENAARVLHALQEFGFGSVGLAPDDFSVPERVVQLGYPPIRIDIITSISGVSWDEARAGQVAGEAFQGKILAQRIVGIAFPHEDAAQIGMARELDSHHVENLALMPIRALVDRHEGIDGGIVLADLEFHAQVRLVVRAAERAEFIDDLVAWLVAEVVDARYINEKVITEFRFEMGGGGADNGAVDLDGLLAAKFPGRTDLAGKLLLQGGDGVIDGHIFNRKT